jgi:hypothetical protein
MNLNEFIRIKLKLALNHFAGTTANLHVNRVCDDESALIRLLLCQRHGITASDEVSNGFKHFFLGQK